MMLLRVNDMMAKFKCSRATIYNYIDSGIIPRPFHLGKTPVWQEEEIDAMLERLKEK